MNLDILVPLDQSNQAKKAFEFALTEYPAERLTLLHIIDPSDIDYLAESDREVTVPSSDEYDALVDETTQFLDGYVDRAEDEEVTAEAVHTFGDPARTIVEYTTKHDIDHVLIGSHGRTGLSRVLLGSVAEKVVRRAPVPVTVVRGDVTPGSQNILVPMDESEQAKKALDYAIKQYPDDSIKLLNVFSRGPPEVHLTERGKSYDQLRARRKSMFDQIAAEKNHRGDIDSEVIVGDPARVITNYATEQGIDHIVMGSHGRDGLARVLLGSVAESVVRRAPVSVTVVR